MLPPPPIRIGWRVIQDPLGAYVTSEFKEEKKNINSLLVEIYLSFFFIYLFIFLLNGSPTGI